MIPKLLALFLVVSIHLYIHECGHYVAARSLDVEVKEFYVGSGPVLYHGTLSNGVDLRIALYPTEGHVLHAGGTNPHWELITISMAGMASTALFAFLIYAVVFIAVRSGIPIRRSLWSAFRLSFLEWLLFPFRLLWRFVTLKPYLLLERVWAMMLCMIGKSMKLGKTEVSGVTLALLASANVIAVLTGMDMIPSLVFGGDVDMVGMLVLFNCFGLHGISAWILGAYGFYMLIAASIILFSLFLPYRIYKWAKAAVTEADELTADEDEHDEDKDKDLSGDPSG
jgi:hypothetical protein